MLKKTSVHIGLLLLGIALFASSFAFRGEEFKTVAGILIGSGAGLMGMSAANLLMKRIEQKNPALSKQMEIELKDERNVMIRNQAKASAGDITQWFIIGIAFLMIFIDAPLWATLTTVGVFVLYHILAAYFTSKYQREM